MTILLIAFDSTPIHYTTFVKQHVFNAGLFLGGKKNCVKSVDFGQESTENRMPSRSVGVGVYLVGAVALQQYILGSNTEVGDICLASGVFCYYIKS